MGNSKELGRKGVAARLKPADADAKAAASWWFSVVSLCLTFVGVPISVIALTQSCDQTSAARTIPFQTALYQARVAARQEYARAEARLDSAYRVTLSDMPHGVWSPAALEQNTDLEMQENARLARQYMDSYEAYFVVLKANDGLWPKDIQKKVQVAADRASLASQCFFRLGEKTLLRGTYTQEEIRESFRQVRQRAALPCKGINDGKLWRDFQSAGTEALAAMKAHLVKTQNDLVPSEE